MFFVPPALLIKDIIPIYLIPKFLVSFRSMRWYGTTVQKQQPNTTKSLYFQLIITTLFEANKIIEGPSILHEFLNLF